MKTKIDYFDYDTLLQPTDWRFAAAVVGLCKYFDYFGIDYKVLCGIFKARLPHRQGLRL